MLFTGIYLMFNTTNRRLYWIPFIFSNISWVVW